MNRKESATILHSTQSRNALAENVILKWKSGTANKIKRTKRFRTNCIECQVYPRIEEDLEFRIANYGGVGSQSPEILF